MVPGLVFGTESIKAKQKPLPFLLNKRVKADCKGRETPPLRQAALPGDGVPGGTAGEEGGRRGLDLGLPPPGPSPARKQLPSSLQGLPSGLWAPGVPAVSLGNSHNMAGDFLSLPHEPRRQAF